MLANLVVIEGGKFHEEIVGMLAIHNGTPERGFALLEEFRITFLRNRAWFEAQHGSERQSTAAKLALRHGHESHDFEGDRAPGRS